MGHDIKTGRMTTFTKTRYFVSPLLLVLANFTLIATYCVNLANCSTYNTKSINQLRRMSKGAYNPQELFDDLYDISVDEGRTFSVSNISLAITYITFIVSLVMLGGFIWLAVSAGSGSSDGGYGSYNRRIFSEGITDWLFSGGNYFGYDSDNNRQKRSSNSDFKDQAMASKLHMLDESLRKFEMDDIGCQMLLSCEAAQLETMKHPIYGNLTPKIHKLLSTAKTSRQSKSGQRVEKLLQAHREGRKQGASCKKLYGDLCHGLMDKIEKAEKEDKDRADSEILNTQEEVKKEPITEGKENKGFWDKKSAMTKFDMDKKLLIKKKKYRMKY